VDVHKRVHAAALEGSRGSQSHRAAWAHLAALVTCD
jgi:hypothetical protein